MARKPWRRLAKTSLVIAILAFALIVTASATLVTVTKANVAAYGGSFIRPYYDNQNPPTTGCTSPCLTVDTQTTQPTAAVSAPALDGRNYATSLSGTITSVATTLTTSHAPDVIVVLTTTQVSTGYVTVSNVASIGLTFSKRASTTAAVGGYDMDFEEWYAIASSTLSGATVTVTYSGTVTHYAVLNAFGVSGANTNTPFDPNGGLPNVKSQAAATITTSYANDFLFGFELTAATGSPTVGAGWNSISTPGGQYFGSEYQQVSATQTSLTVTWSNAATDADGMLGDSIQASNSFTVSNGASAYLWSPQFGSATTVSASPWYFDFWGTASSNNFVPITLTNNQGSATPNPYQAMVQVNPSTYSSYEASDLGNVAFCLDNACVTRLYSWLEGCGSSSPYGPCSTASIVATFWVKLTSAIGANGGSLTIYMVFLSTSTEFDGVYRGEAPQLTNPYASYDNGANVFDLYFNGNTATAGFNIGANNVVAQTTATNPISGGAALHVISLTGYGANNRVNMVFTTPLPAGNPTYGEVAESYSEIQTGYTGNMQGLGGFCDSTTAGSTTMNAESEEVGNGGSLYAYIYVANGAPTTVAGGGADAALTWYYASLAYPGTSSTSFSGVVSTSFYAPFAASTANHPITGSAQLYWCSVGSRLTTNPDGLYFNWGRARAYPPGNVAPTVAIGTLASNTFGVSIYITNSAGTITSTVANNVQSPLLGATKTEYSMATTGAQVSIPANGYISIVITAPTNACTIYWGVGQPTNFQVSFTSRST